jgi:thymidylate synthase
MNAMFAENAEEAYEKLAYTLAVHNGQVMNSTVEIRDMSEHGYTLETDLFPLEALKAYTEYNLQGNGNAGSFIASKKQLEWMSPERGGGQGNYNTNMQQKIERVVLALKTKSSSKRAVLTIPFTDKCSLCVKLTDTDEWKCLREVYFSIGKDGRLHATGIMRSQALSIFSKNIHFLGTLMNVIAEQLGVPVGSYTHFCHFLVADRS